MYDPVLAMSKTGLISKMSFQLHPKRLQIRTGCVQLKCCFSLLYTFSYEIHFYLINIHIIDYPDSRLFTLFTGVPTSPDNRGSTVVDFQGTLTALHEKNWYISLEAANVNIYTHCAGL